MVLGSVRTGRLGAADRDRARVVVVALARVARPVVVALARGVRRVVVAFALDRVVAVRREVVLAVLFCAVGTLRALVVRFFAVERLASAIRIASPRVAASYGLRRAGTQGTAAPCVEPIPNCGAALGDRPSPMSVLLSSLNDSRTHLSTHLPIPQMR
jgi:hypothetical protein